MSRNPVAGFSNWFDTLGEPKRFFAFVTLVFGGFVWGLTGLTLHSYNAHLAASSLFFGLSVLSFLFFYAVAIYRFFRK